MVGTLAGLFRQSIFGRLARYEDVNDAERLRHDPAMRWIVGGKAAQGCAASPSQMGRFETRWLAAHENLSALADLSGQWIDLIVHGRRPPGGIVLDMDSSVSPTRRAGDECLERPLRLHPLPPAVRLQPVRRPKTMLTISSEVSRIYFPADAAFAMPEAFSKPSRSNMRSACRRTKFSKRGSTTTQASGRTTAK
jgi:hypothetical protein